MFRLIPLPKKINGHLFLHSMPGRFESWEAFSDAANKIHLDAIFCLTPTTEIESKSPNYAAALTEGIHPWDFQHFPVPDFSAPDVDDRPAYRSYIQFLAHQLLNGKTCLLHCGAGIGRTGTAAFCLLLELGTELPDARQTVQKAGSGPEVPQQQSFLDWYAAEVRKNP